MPPKKEVKEKAVKGDEAYMRETNRPYANADVSANLKNRVPKAAAVKVLAALADKGLLTVKPYGKQLIYLYNQTLLEVLAPEAMSSLDDKIKGVKDNLEDKRKELKFLLHELQLKEGTLRTCDLQAQITRIATDNDTTLKALLPFRGDAGEAHANPLSAEDTKAIDEDFTKWRKEWVNRKKVYKELLDMLVDGGQIDSISAFEEDQGVCLDDDEAKEVEKGEFCNPLKQAKPAVKAMQKLGGDGESNDTGKRSMSGTPATGDDGGKKKKAKKG
ncbi:hypothetical protein IAU60_000447 [Kwoniella sp. DSM 27419]